MGPFIFDGVEIGGIGWQEFKDMSGGPDGILNIQPFVERCIVHHDNAMGREFRQ